MNTTALKNDEEIPGERVPNENTPPRLESMELQQERRHMFRAAGIIGAMTIVSRLLGIARNHFLARVFGASWISDAFNLAFILPNLTRRIFGEGALSSAFVPVFSEKLTLGKKDAAHRTASIVLCRLVFLLLLACVVLVGLSLCLRHLVPLPENIALTLKLTELMIWYCILMNAAAVVMGILNSLRHFSTPALSPVLLNVCMLVALTYGLDLLGSDGERQVTVVALSVLIAGVLQLAVMLPALFGRGFKFTPSLDTQDEGYREAMKNFGPVMVAAALFQLNTFLDQIVARLCIPEDGPVTMLAYGNLLVLLPWSLFSLAMATAALPTLSRYWASRQLDHYAKTLSSAVRLTFYLALPSTVGLCILSQDIVRLVYGTGEFLANDGEPIRRTGQVVFYLALGLCFYSINAVLVRALNATKETACFRRIAYYAVGSNLILNLCLVWTMREAGLALASAISAMIQTVFLVRELVMRTLRPNWGRFNRFAIQIFGTAAASAALAVVVYNELSRRETMEAFIAFFAALAIATIPVIMLARHFFKRELGVEPLKGDQALQHRFGIPEKHWSDDLIFYHGIYNTMLIAAVMGLVVWAVQDSLPPEGQAFALALQRGIIPVIAGVLVYIVFSGGCQSREYQELFASFFKAKKQTHR